MSQQRKSRYNKDDVNIKNVTYACCVYSIIVLPMALQYNNVLNTFSHQNAPLVLQNFYPNDSHD